MRMLLVRALARLLPGPARRAAFRRRLMEGYGRGFAPADAFWIVREQCPYVPVCDGRDTFLFDRRDETLSRQMFLRPTREREQLERFFALAELYYPGARGVFLEAGGNVGTASLAARHHGRVERVVSFEPAAANRRVFEVNRLLNGVSADEVELVPAALSNRPGLLEMVVDRLNPGGSHLRTGPGAGGETETVAVVTLDDFVRERGMAPGDIGFLWLDVEGYEGFALDGARVVTENPIPVVIEFCPRMLREAGGFELLLDTLRRYYRRYVVMAEFAGNPDATHTMDGLEALARRLEAEGPLGMCDLFLVK